MEMLVFSLCVVSVLVEAHHGLNCNPSDLNSLRAFVEHLDSGVEGWDFASVLPNCCSWRGVTCGSGSNGHVDSGRIVKLELGRGRLVGNVSGTLGELDRLRTLNLSHNYLRGSIPDSLLKSPNLEVLDLSYNGISGTFPKSINLPSIKVLNVSHNKFNGPVPVGICSNTSKVLVMRFSGNDFSGILPVGFGNCSSLQDLDVSKNSISGSLPDDLFSLHSLQRLDLQENQFSGQLSREIGNLSNLAHLDLSSNEFSGNLPDVFDRLVQLNTFLAQSNKFTGKLPYSLANSPAISLLNLGNNSLSGIIDLNCSALVNLISINLAANLFHGKIPEYLPTCRKLTTVNLARTSFSGKIPESFRDFQTLAHLSLSNSGIIDLVATLDILQHCRNLKTLVLTSNFCGEEMPGYPDLNFVQLQALVIANCKLTGYIPRWLNGCKKLELLDLSWNQLGGSIPAWVGGFPSLFYLDLSNNSLTGEIPKELTRMLTLINGSVSMEGSSLGFPFFVRRNRHSYKYKRIMSFPSTLKLGNNFLTGPILPEFGNLKTLLVLDLKCNKLSGSIPESLSGMRSLETLDLSFNNLTGTIPSSLSKLSFLSNFNVAHNHLRGRIPSEGQFLTFYNSGFAGNPNLCGAHISHPCSDNSVILLPPSPHKPKKPRCTIIGIGIGTGLGIAVLTAIMSFAILHLHGSKVVEPGKINDAQAMDNNFEESSDMVIPSQDEGEGDNNAMFLTDLVKATNNFDQSNIVGCGGFGLVYKGELTNGRKVAIKRLSGENFRMEREFQAEVESLSRAQHPNLVQLRGYCRYKNDRLLIYPYMENGSLDYWLHEKGNGPSSLGWDKRLHIAQGAARGLAYLHNSCEPHILHRDIKSSNILLDEEFKAHLADFGLARLILPYDTHVTTDLIGTLGYIPPEYGQVSVATYKGDIYSFGVVLLELLTGKRPMDVCGQKGSRDLISWVIKMKAEERETEVFDRSIIDNRCCREMANVLGIACLCLNESPRLRPDSQQLVSWLDDVDSMSCIEGR